MNGGWVRAKIETLSATCIRFAATHEKLFARQDSSDKTINQLLGEITAIKWILGGGWLLTGIIYAAEQGVFA